MVQNWKIKKQVNEFVELLAFSPVKQFYPTAVPKYSEDLDLEHAFQYLLELCKSGEIHLLWEVQCVNDEDLSFCLRTLDKVPDYQAIFNKNYKCDVCGTEQKADHDHLIPLFEIDEDYRTYIRDELKKKQKTRQRLEVKSKMW
jgi:hypothetical protein